MKQFITIISLGVGVYTYSQSAITCEEEEIKDVNSINKCFSNIKQRNSSNNTFIKVKRNKIHTLEKIRKEEIKPNTDKTLNLNHTNFISNSIEIIRFHETTTIPLFSNCINIPNSENLKCFNQELKNHIKKFFNYPKEAISNKIEGQVWVKFIIDKNGNIKNINAHGPKNGKSLELEATKLISKLPKFKPGIKNNKNVNVSYTTPINFYLKEKRWL